MTQETQQGSFLSEIVKSESPSPGSAGPGAAVDLNGQERHPISSVAPPPNCFFARWEYMLVNHKAPAGKLRGQVAET
jgi:hypothetical protein